MSKSYQTALDEERSYDVAEALRNNDAIVDILVNWQRKVLGFYGHRWQQYADLPARLAKCKSPRDLHELRSQFFDEMFSEYREKSKELFDMTQELTGQALRQEDQHYEKSLLKAQEDAKQLLRQAEANAEKIVRDAEIAAEKIVKQASSRKSSVA